MFSNFLSHNLFSLISKLCIFETQHCLPSHSKLESCRKISATAATNLANTAKCHRLLQGGCIVLKAYRWYETISSTKGSWRKNICWKILGKHLLHFLPFTGERSYVMIKKLVNWKNFQKLKAFCLVVRCISEIYSLFLELNAWIYAANTVENLNIRCGLYYPYSG